MKKPLGIAATLLFALIFGSGCSFAEEMFHKFRVSVSVNAFSSTDQLKSNADNVSLFHGPLGGVVAIPDPRPDAAVKHTDQVRDNVRYDLGLSYGLLKWRTGELTIDSGVGYFKSRLGDLEVAGEFSTSAGGVDPPRTALAQLTRYHGIFIPMGEITQVPVEIGGTVRFRPKKPLSPYLGAGVGYVFAKIDATPEFDQFSYNVSHSLGAYSIPNGTGGSRPGSLHKLRAAKVETPDTFEYHVSGGLEYSIGPHMSAVINTAWLWATQEIDVTIDGRHDFGSAIPNGATTYQFPNTGLPVVIDSGHGGLVDYGSGEPFDDPFTNKRFLGPKDGIPDPGHYYAQGGTLRYGGFEVGIGLRYFF